MAQYVFSAIDEFSHMCLNSYNSFFDWKKGIRIDLLVIDEAKEWGKSQTWDSTGFINEMPLKYAEISNRL